MLLSSLLSLSFLSFQPPPSSPCQGPLSRDKVVACARAASPRIALDRLRVGVAEARRESARIILPANPVLSASVSHRANTTGQQAVNATGTLSQEIEVGGQRRRRRDVANRRVEQAERGIAVSERDVTAEALHAYFDVLAAQAEAKLIERSLQTARALVEVARERAAAGIGAPIDIDLAAAERTRTEEQAALARGRIAVASTQLATLIGLDPDRGLPEVRGELRPFPVEGPGGTRGAQARQNRPELAVADAQRKTQQAELRLLKRRRLPNPSLSFFVQRDGFDERVIGGGLSLPLPLPAPLGRVRKGEIAATRARIAEADAQRSATQRTVTMEAAIAQRTYTARRDAVSVYPPEVIEPAQQTLQDLVEQSESGRLPVRDALVAQQALQDMLLRAIHARHALATASVELAHASGQPFEGGGQ